MNSKRVRVLRKGNFDKGPVLYWMQRDQRVHDNWALLYAQQQAIEKDSSLIVVFCVTPSFPGATLQQYSFMLKGLEEVEKKLHSLKIPFKMLIGDPAIKIPKFVTENRFSKIVTDFNPLKIINKWKKSICKNLTIPFDEVDTHNIVPCWVASPKLEYAAYTIRPKINKLLDEYADEFIEIKKQIYKLPLIKNDWNEIRNSLQVDTNSNMIDWLSPGEDEAHKVLENFINNKLDFYASERNDPNLDALSNLSPYLHFGQIAAQRVYLALQPIMESINSKESFLEELTIRRELSDNFCYYNSNYDSFNGIPEWAKKTLNEHRKDEREYLYDTEQFEHAKTHDHLWNAAQTEMITKGKMHGYMRMYWAKKILEWTETPEKAFEVAIYLNDKYQLDGRDPNGYAGIAWSIGGVHDRAWGERPIFGKIRYMNYNGCKRKFDVNSYIKKYLHNDQGELNLKHISHSKRI